MPNKDIPPILCRKSRVAKVDWLSADQQQVCEFKADMATVHGLVIYHTH